MSDNSRFIGRGENLSKKIMLRLIDCVGIESQVNIKWMIDPIEFIHLDQEVRNHNFDLVLRRNNGKDIVIEVNYKHGEKAARKARTIFGPLVRAAGHEYITIDDYDCRKKGIFYLDSKKEHEITWDDFYDIIDALVKAGVKPQ
ncbi:MAG: hypothetical protein JKY15_01860 [Deltaproteobacteria bacterium]|nr:hypothetical protein [Deltaproteobacteria bacterium]